MDPAAIISAGTSTSSGVSDGGGARKACEGVDVSDTVESREAVRKARGFDSDREAVAIALWCGILELEADSSALSGSGGIVVVLDCD